MKITKRQLRRIIRESLMKEYNGYGPGSRGEPGHKDPETGNWVDPGTPGYNPEMDKTLHNYAAGEYEKALKAHESFYMWGGKKVRSMGPQVDTSWKHPAYR